MKVIPELNLALLLAALHTHTKFTRDFIIIAIEERGQRGRSGGLGGGCM